MQSASPSGGGHGLPRCTHAPLLQMSLPLQKIPSLQDRELLVWEQKKSVPQTSSVHGLASSQSPLFRQSPPAPASTGPRIRTNAPASATTACRSTVLPFGMRIRSRTIGPSRVRDHPERRLLT
jgi:hypothetical protein